MKNILQFYLTPFNFPAPENNQRHSIMGGCQGVYMDNNQKFSLSPALNLLFTQGGCRHMAPDHVTLTQCLRMLEHYILWRKFYLFDVRNNIIVLCDNDSQLKSVMGVSAMEVCQASCLLMKHLIVV